VKLLSFKQQVAKNIAVDNYKGIFIEPTPKYRN
jgi:hypothetical protein